MRNGMVIGILGLLCVVGCGKQEKQDSKKPWDGTEDLTCGGSDKVHLEQRTC